MPHRSAQRSRRHASPAWRQQALWAALLLTPTLAQAMLLQRPVVHAILGQPLRVDIPVQLDASEQLANTCVQAQADVGDQPLRADQLQVALRHAGKGLDRIQLQSTVPINEPFVVLTLKLGCQYQRSQQYTFLVNPPTPELPVGELGSASSAATASPAPSVNTAAPQGSGAALRGGSAADAQSVLAGGFGAQQAQTDSANQAQAPLQRPHPAPSRPQRPERTQTRERVAPERAAMARRYEHQPRRATPQQPTAVAKPVSQLKLDWLSAALIPAPDLRISATLALPATPITPAQRKDYAQLRDIIMDGAAAPGEPLRLSQKLNALDAQVAGLKAGQSQDGRQLAIAQAQLTALKRSSFASAWVYALAALAAILGFVALWLWRDRSQRIAGDDHWFAPQAEVNAQAKPYATTQAMVAGPASVTARGKATSAMDAADAPAGQHSGPSTWPPAHPVDELGNDAMAEDMSLAATRPQTTQPPQWGQALSLDKETFSRPLSGVELVQVDEMMDIGHLADFFIGIGNPEQAIEVMEKALSEASGSTLALPYLYLFELYRQTGRKDDFEALLARYANRFNVQIPPWDGQLSAEARELEAYPRAIALICETWDLAPMMTVLERMLLDDPSKPRVGFDLPAYRDLLDLYAVARDLSKHPAEASREVQAMTTSMRTTSLSSDLDMPLLLHALSDTPAASASHGAHAPDLAPLDFTLDDQVGGKAGNKADATPAKAAQALPIAPSTSVFVHPVPPAAPDDSSKT